MTLTILKSKETIPNNRIAFKTVEGYVFLDPEEIIRIEANLHQSLLFSTRQEKPFKLAVNITVAENELELYNKLFFFRCHLVNVIHIMEFKEKIKLLITSRGDIPISINRIYDFKKIMC